MIDQMEGLNIKDFVVENPVVKPELPFDPRRDITEDDRKGILGRIDRMMEPEANPDTVRHAAQMLAHLKLIRPEMTSGISLSDENKGKIIESINSHISIDVRNYLLNAWPLYVLDEQRLKEVEEEWGFDKNSLSDDANWGIVGPPHYMYLYKMSFPSENVLMNKDSVFNYVENLKKYELNSQKKDDKSELNLKNYIRGLARLRIVAPDLVDEIGINPSLVGQGKGVLDTMRKAKNHEEFLEYAFYLTALNAKDITVSSNRLTFTMPDQNGGFNDKAQMPEVRKF